MNTFLVKCLKAFALTEKQLLHKDLLIFHMLANKVHGNRSSISCCILFHNAQIPQLWEIVKGLHSFRRGAVDVRRQGVDKCGVYPLAPLALLSGVEKQWIIKLIAWVADSLHRVTTKGSGEILQRLPSLPSPLSLFRSFSVSPLPRSNMTPRQTFHWNLRAGASYAGWLNYC